MKDKFLIHKNKIILTLLDILIIIASCYVAKILFSTNGYLSEDDVHIVFRSIILYIIIYQIFFRSMYLYRNITRFENGRDYLGYMSACALSCATTLIINLISKSNFLQTKEAVLAGILIAVVSISYRVLIRMIVMYATENENIEKEGKVEKKNLLIIGAGVSARDIIRSLRETMKQSYNIVGIVDDNPGKFRYSLSGVSILGNRYDIERICAKYNVQEIFFSISKIAPKDRKEILNICQKTNAKLRTLPSTEELIKNKNLLENMKDVEIEDLLGRAPIVLDNNNIENLIKNNVVLVTGGGGSIGSELCRQIITYNPKQLIIFDIYENNLYDIQMELDFRYPDANVEAIVGSVRDKNKVNDVFKKYKPSLVFHAAAHKHVPLMEASPLEAIKNNVLGTKNVVNAADEFGTQRFILISTDKAVNPTNIMGATKRMCEMIVQAKNQHSNTEYAAVRFGNVLGSNGSVIPLLKKQIKDGGPVTVTHKEITRFFMTIPEAVGLVLQAMTYANGGEIFVLDMGEPVKIYDLAVSLIKLSGLRPDIDIPIEITGLRPGEKLYEEILMSEEGLTKTNHNKIFIAKPLDEAYSEIDARVDKMEHMVENENHTLKDVTQLMKEVIPTFEEAETTNKRIIAKNKQQEENKKNEVRISAKKVIDNQKNK